MTSKKLQNIKKKSNDELFFFQKFICYTKLHLSIIIHISIRFPFSLSFQQTEYICPDKSTCSVIRYSENIKICFVFIPRNISCLLTY